MAISAKEAELYDRQIRLWGVEAQARMQKATVLLMGLSGVHTEVLIWHGAAVPGGWAVPEWRRDER